MIINDIVMFMTANNHYVYNVRALDSALDIIDRTRVSGLMRLGFDCQCVKCGIYGNVVVIHRHINEPDHYRHFDVFSTNENRQPRMMTLDHILPHSWGGANALTNMQIMCKKCNENKGNVITNQQFVSIIDNIHLHWSPNGLKRLQLIPKIFKYKEDLLTPTFVNTLVDKLTTFAEAGDFANEYWFNKQIDELLHCVLPNPIIE